MIRKRAVSMLSAAVVITAAMFGSQARAQVDPCSQNTQLTGGSQQAVTGGEDQKMGNVSNTDFHYELWRNNQHSSQPVNMTVYGNQAGGAAFRMEWSEPGENFDNLGRVGYFYGNNGKKFTEHGDFFADYSYERSGRQMGNNYSYIGIYGWAKSDGSNAPLVEYYIVDDWWGNRHQEDNTPVGPATFCNNCAAEGSFTVDGAVYNIYKNERVNEPSIEGNTTFMQYFSVRQTPRKCGTISISEHFRKWAELNLKMGNLYEVKLLAEIGAYPADGHVASSGYIDYRYATIREGSLCNAGSFPLTVSASPALGGTILKSPPNMCFAPGTSVTLVATANDGWAFDGWEGAGITGTGDTLVLTTGSAAQTVAAKFKLNNFGVNFVENGNFPGTSLAPPWQFNVYDGSAGTGAVANGEFTANVTGLPNESGGIWSVQLLQATIPLLKGNNYRVTFEASGQSQGVVRTMQVMCQRNGGDYKTYWEQTVNLSVTKESFTFDFEMEEDDDPLSRIAFNFAGMLGSVTISNVSVVLLEGPSSIGSGAAAPRLISPQLVTVRGRTLTVNGSPDTRVRVRVVDMAGRTVARRAVRGGSSIRLNGIPAGIYVVEARRAGDNAKTTSRFTLR